MFDQLQITWDDIETNVETLGLNDLSEALAEVKKETLEKLLARKPKDEKPFITIVDKILTAKETNPEAATNKLEKQIDEMVYKLYELTELEIAIIENKK